MRGHFWRNSHPNRAFRFFRLSVRNTINHKIKGAAANAATPFLLSFALSVLEPSLALFVRCTQVLTLISTTTCNPCRQATDPLSSSKQGGIIHCPVTADSVAPGRRPLPYLQTVCPPHPAHYHEPEHSVNSARTPTRSSRPPSERRQGGYPISPTTATRPYEPIPVPTTVPFSGATDAQGQMKTRYGRFWGVFFRRKATKTTETRVFRSFRIFPTLDVNPKIKGAAAYAATPFPSFP